MKSTIIPTRSVRSAGAHRINIGLTLLAVIFLIVMVAAAGVRSNRPSSTVSPRGETLAVLGVAPGSGETSNTVAAESRQQTARANSR